MLKIGQILIFLIFLLVPLGVSATGSDTGELSGKILLETERAGEAWYVSPEDHRRYFLGRPVDAFNVMRGLGLGITDLDLEKIPLAAEKTEVNMEFRRRLAGRILLQVESLGEAWYVDKEDLERHSLGRPDEAFKLLRSFGLGISGEDISRIAVGDGTEKIRTVAHEVPFVPQAPFAEWNDLRHQEACEETSVLLAMKWVKGEPVSREEAREALLAMSEWQRDKFGYYHDTSAQDTADRLFRDYYGYENIEVLHGIDASDIVGALLDGHIVITPINGLTVGNPYFSSPGPLRHMILIIGYDAETEKFIVHDPGTRRGENFRYARNAINISLRDYPSGVYVPIPEDSLSAMIVVKK